jgi:hypothetical protein
MKYDEIDYSIGKMKSLLNKHHDIHGDFSDRYSRIRI